jgi:redox-sensitive bicupin YhaK (pirin superfamily)
MLNLRKAGERGYAQRSWLKTWHTFSFADYYDANHMQFGHLRVINDDEIAGGGGFPTHPHRDMEIVTYVLEGALEHKDSMGNGSVIRPGEVQRMSAGTGIRHSEFNHSPSEPARLLQIWILPDRQGHEPGYEQKVFSEADKRGRLCLVASADGRDGSVSIHQDLYLYAALIDGQESAGFELATDRKAWVQVARGSLELNGQSLSQGDGVAVTDSQRLEFTGGNGAEILLFDLSKKS